jgi:hypothetical protein
MPSAPVLEPIPLGVVEPSALLPLEVEGEEAQTRDGLFSEDDALLDSLLDGFEDIFDAPTSALTPPSSPLLLGGEGPST